MAPVRARRAPRPGGPACNLGLGEETSPPSTTSTAQRRAGARLRLPRFGRGRLVCGTPEASRRPPRAPRGGRRRSDADEPPRTRSSGDPDGHRPVGRPPVVAQKFRRGLAAVAGPGRRKLGVRTSPSRRSRRRPPRAASSRPWSADLSATKGGAWSSPAPANPLTSTPSPRRSSTLGNDGANGTVNYLEPIEAEPVDQVASLAALCKAHEGGAVDVLIVLGGNPAYSTPADSGKFVEGLKKSASRHPARAARRRDLGPVDWHVPETHELEAWGDAVGRRHLHRATAADRPPVRGLASRPRKLMAALLDHPNRSRLRDLLRDHLRDRTPEGTDFETFWKTAVHAGAWSTEARQTVKAEPVADLGPAPAAGKHR